MYAETLIEAAWETHQILRDFNGTRHAHIIDEFRDLDNIRMQTAREEVARTHYERIPRNQSAVGEYGVLAHEFARKRHRISIRTLMEKAGNIIKDIKPVFMMSPMSVAQYLTPGKIEFDLLLIDEASQVIPSHALGAIARSDQLVVVGDSHQLPPTRFWESSSFDEDEDHDETEVVDTESSLQLAESHFIMDDCSSFQIPKMIAILE